MQHVYTNVSVCIYVFACVLLFMFCVTSTKRRTPVPLTFPSCSHDELLELFIRSEERYTDPCFVPRHLQTSVETYIKITAVKLFTISLIVEEVVFFH